MSVQRSQWPFGSSSGHRRTDGERVGGQQRLLGISKRGDMYLRTLLIHGARALLFHWMRQDEHRDGWLMRLRTRRNPNVTAVALASKNARVVWALLAHQREYCAAPFAATV